MALKDLISSVEKLAADADPEIVAELEARIWCEVGNIGWRFDELVRDFLDGGYSVIKVSGLRFPCPRFTTSLDAIYAILPAKWRLMGFVHAEMTPEVSCVLTRPADGIRLKSGQRSAACATLQISFLHAALLAIDWERKQA